MLIAIQPTVSVAAAVLAGSACLMFSRQAAVGLDGRVQGNNGTTFAAGAAGRPKRPL